MPDGQVPAGVDTHLGHTGRIVRVIGERPERVDGVEYRRCNVVLFDGRTYVLSHRAILTLVVLSSCNAGCRFCSNEITFTPAGGYLEWDDRLARIKAFALIGGVRKIAYTGGEPTLNPQRLLDLISAMNPGFARSRLHTNGFGLFKTVNTANGPRTLLEAMRGVGLTGVSMSVAHFDEERNRDIMVLPKSWAGMTRDELAAVAACRTEDFTPRLSCVMTNEGIHTTDDIFEYIDWGYELGFRKFIFRTCSEIPTEYQKPTPYSAYNDDNRLTADAIAEQLDRRHDVIRTYRQRKSDSKVDVYQWRDVSFDVDESAEEVDPDAKIRRLNVMSNGAVHTSWIDPMSVLFEDDRELARRSADREVLLSLRETVKR